MKRPVLILSIIFVVILFSACSDKGNDSSDNGNGDIEKVPAGGTLYTAVNSDGIGNIAVRVKLPETARYGDDGAPVVIQVPCFFTAVVGFYENIDCNLIGFINVALLWPGKTDPETGAYSDGTYNYGDESCIRALKDVIRFITGEVPDTGGHYLSELIEIEPIYENSGVFAFSHPGIAGTNVLALYGSEIPKVKYFVGRENPTLDAMSSVEIGFVGDDGVDYQNPLYRYPECYSDTALFLDYTSVDWYVHDSIPEGRPVFVIDDSADHILCYKCPRMWDERYYSIELTQALLDNGALTMETWPSGVANPIETARDWPFRTTVRNYPYLATELPNLRVMLIFGKRDHIQAAPDKPHIHQAYAGFKRGAGLWVRLNPDRCYVASMNCVFADAFPDEDANTEPPNWIYSRDWGYPNVGNANMIASLAGVAEMADRVQADIWDDNLDQVLCDYENDVW